MRVLQVMAGAAHGGAELFFERLTIALGRAGVQQRAVIRAQPERSARLRGAGIECVELPFGGPFDWRTTPALKREIANYQPDIALAWMSRAAQKLPRHRPRDSRPIICARLGGYYPLKYYRNCDHLIGNTRGILEHLLYAGWPASRSHYLPNFADPTIAPAVPRAQFSTPDAAPLLLAMGRLHDNKGFDVLLEALGKVPPAYLWIAGEGPLEAELKKISTQLGVADRVRFLGWRDDGPALLAAADMLVCPSRVEPLGNVVIEAWAHHRPVVATRSDGPAALIRHGDNGLLENIDDPDGLAHSITQLIEKPEYARQIAANGYAAYAEQFTEAAVVQAYIEFFDRIAV